MKRLTAALALALAACTNQSPPAPPPSATGEVVAAPIVTDRNAYIMRNGELTITATFTAPADGPVYLTNCNGAQPMGLQRLVGNDWVNSWVAALNGCFSAPIEVPPGGRHSATLTLRPGAGAVTYPRGQESIESGNYRVVWFGVLRSYDPKKRPSDDDELPLEQRVSGPFMIDVQRPALASTPPPPPPGPRVASANVSGQVVDARGFRVAHAEVLVRSADAGCRPLGPFAGAVSSENGDYFAVAQLESDQPLRGCVIVEARSGGTSGKATLGVEFTTASPRVHLDVRLERAPPLTSVEAERLVRMLAAAIDEPAQTPRELGQYILHGPEALRVALGQYRTLLGKVTAVRPIDSFHYELRGAKGATSRVNVHQEDLVRLHSPLLALLWRLHGTGPNGEEVLEPVELGFGDGLIGMRGL